MTERVSGERVVRYWLGREFEAGADVPDPAGLSFDEAVDALLSAKPGAAAFLWRETPIRWYRLALDRATFAGLRPVGGPETLLWRDLSTDGTLVGVAERLDAAGDGALREETAVDLDAVTAYRDAVATGRALDPLIVRTRRGRTPWFVVDGNHRAAGAALHAVETGEYVPQTAYVAVTANPVLGPAVARVRGAIQRLRGRPVGFEGAGSR